MYIAQLERQLIQQMICQFEKVRAVGRSTNSVSVFSNSVSMDQRNRELEVRSYDVASPKAPQGDVDTPARLFSKAKTKMKRDKTCTTPERRRL